MSDTGLRERKKLATQRTIIEAARRLVAERGLDDVTVDDIAAEADVSARTFFNYFASKAEAVVATEPGLLAALGDALRARPATEDPVVALRAVLFVYRGDSLDRWVLRHELATQHPRLLSRHLAATAAVEEVLTTALAQRMGVDARRDATPRTLVATVMGAARSAVAWWSDSDRARPLTEVVDEAIARVRAPGRW